MKYYDATKEHAPFDRSKSTTAHPNKHNTDKHPVSGKSGTKRKRG